MFKVAVIGGSGLLGRALNNELARQVDWHIVSTAFSRPSPQMVAFDIRDSLAVERFIDHVAPDAVVIAAAERRPDVCERDPAHARALNC
ncbi:dTDP-4-dehydrorhamnose reductase [Paraburkholderia youngii]